MNDKLGASGEARLESNDCRMSMCSFGIDAFSFEKQTKPNMPDMIVAGLPNSNSVLLKI